MKIVFSCNLISFNLLIRIISLDTSQIIKFILLFLLNHFVFSPIKYDVSQEAQATKHHDGETNYDDGNVFAHITFQTFTVIHRTTWTFIIHKNVATLNIGACTLSRWRKSHAFFVIIAKLSWYKS